MTTEPVLSGATPAFALLTTPRPRPVSFAGSILFHGVLLALAIWIAPYLGPDPGAIRTIPLRVEIRIPPTSFLSAPAKAAAAPRPAALGTPSPVKAGVPPPRLILPQLRPIQDSQLTIVLPNLIKPPTAKIQEIAVPSMMTWTPSRIKPKDFVMPGARQTRPPDLQNEAQLSLDLPKNLPAVADLTMRPAPAPEFAKLKVQVSATRPVRVFQPPQPRQAPPSAPLETVIGDPTSLIVLSPSPKQAVDRMRLPDGSQIAAIHAARPAELPAPPPVVAAEVSLDKPGAGGTATASMPKAEPARTQGGTPAGGVASGVPQVAAPVGGPPGEPGGLPGGIKIAGGTGSAGGAVTGIPGPPAVLSESTVPIRVEHPVNGVFDVVVVQSSPLNEFPGVASLSGSPIYTVYVPVGRTRMWALQFCVPKEKVVTKQEGIVVQLGNPSPVKPPYPLVTVAPPSAGRIEKIVVHGFISDAGQFEELRVLTGEKAATEYLVLPLLQRWQMRPATRDGRPVRVEVLLLISG